MAGQSMYTPYTKATHTHTHTHTRYSEWGNAYFSGVNSNFVKNEYFLKIFQPFGV